MSAWVGWIAIAVGAIALHEYIVRTSRRMPATVVRYVLLAAAFAAAALAAPSLRDYVEQRVRPRDPAGATFAARGDPHFLHGLSGQQPKFPYPAGAPVNAVELWRQRVLDALREETGIAVDPPASLAATTVDTELVGGVRRSLVTFTSWDGTTIPAYVHEPEGATLKGGLLVVPGHGAGIRATSGIVRDYQESAALELARAGYVTLTPELRGFGLLGLDGSPNHLAVSLAALQAGSSYKAITVKDLGRAITVLQQWPGVDDGRIAVLGTSFGGELAMLVGALDPRVRAVLSHSYGGAVGPASVRVDWRDRDWSDHGCHTIPGVNRILVQEDWARLVAPRPLLVVRGDRDRPGGSAAFDEAVRQAYAAQDAADRFVFATPPGGHRFYLEPSVRFLARWL